VFIKDSSYQLFQELYVRRWIFDKSFDNYYKFAEKVVRVLLIDRTTETMYKY